MINETDLSKETKWLFEERAKTVVNNLRKKNITAQYVANRAEALEAVMAMIPVDAKVTRGDSITVDQVGIPEALERRGQKTIVPNGQVAPGVPFYATQEERNNKAREAFSSDIFLVGTNAITLDGKLINIDGWGNRVSAMIFGPRKVIVVVGVNKIVKDTDEGLARIRSIAGPMNATRHYLKHNAEALGDLPCVRQGVCINCNHERRICHYTVIIDGQSVPSTGRINVVLVGEELGM
jgi:hypothetical protein